MKFNDTVRIGDQIISKDGPAFIIAEAGVNHNGDMETAKKLVDCAASSGVNAVKFQLFKTQNLILQDVEKAPYQNKAVGKDISQYDMLKSLEMGGDALREIKGYCEEKGIIFLCTPFEEYSLNELDEMGVAAYKIAATDLTNLKFLVQVAKKGRPIILSAGMCYMDEVRMALKTIYPINRDVILLQCTANYPLNDNEVNLNIIDTFKKEFDVLVGYSDHSKGVGASPYAVAKGAKLIEKHFTLDRNMKGPDHKASVEPDELKELVERIRLVETYLGDGIKRPTISEQKTRRSLQKCLVALKDISENEVFSEDNLTAMRTGGRGMSALYYFDMLGKPSNKAYRTGEIIDF